MKFALVVILLVSAAYAAPVEDALDLPTKCEDVLAGPVCAKLRGIAQKIGMKFEEVEARIKEAIADGKQKAEEIQKVVMDYFKQHVANKKCEDFLSASQCDKIKKLVKLMGGAAEKVDEAVREAVVEGAKKIKEIYQKVIDYLKDILGAKRSIEMTMTDFDLDLLDELELDDEDAMEKRNIVVDILKKKIKFLAQLLGKVLDSDIDKVLQEVLETRRAEIEQVIGQGPYAILKLAIDLYQKVKALG